MPRTGDVLRDLLDIRASEPSVVSLYLSVPKDPEGLRGLPAQAVELLGVADEDGRGAKVVRDEDRRAVRSLLEQHGRDWLGHTVAIFVSGELGLSEAFPLPCGLPERAVLAVRPHVRPLLVAGQRCPAYLIVVVDRQHARLFRVSGEEISAVAESAAEGVRSSGFGGWYGLDSYRIHERVNQLARHHFRATAATLSEQMRRAGRQLIVVGGHEQTFGQFMAALTSEVADQVAGTFIADPHTLTPARARALAAPVIESWVSAREREAATRFLEEPPGALTVLGLAQCLTAVSQQAVKYLLIPVGGMVPGYACERCGVLSSDGRGCPHGPGAARRVPDLIEEMAVATLASGGEVEAVRDPPGEVAARLRFPLIPSGG